MSKRNKKQPRPAPKAVAPSTVQKSGTTPSAPDNQEVMVLAQAWQMGWSTALSNTGERVDPKTALQSSAVSRCITVLANDVAKLPLHVTKELEEGGYERDSSHPVATLLRRPNPGQNLIEVVSDLITGYALWGNGYAAVLRDAKGRARAVVPLRNGDVVVLPNERTGNIYYQATHRMWAQRSRKFSSRDMIHIRTAITDNGYEGKSPIELSPDAVGIALAISRHVATYFRQGTQLGGLMELTNAVRPEAIAAIKQSWHEQQAGGSNAHKLGILPLGAKWHDVGNSAADAQLNEAAQANTLEIAGLFGVPPHRIGLSDNIKFSNLENLEQQYVNNTLSVICRKVEEALEHALFFEDELARYQIRFDFDALMRGDYKTRIEGRSAAIMSGQLSPNEARVKEGLAPYEGGEKFITPMNMAPADQSPNNLPNTSNAPLLDGAEEN